MLAAQMIPTPLTTATMFSSWQLDAPTLVVVGAVGFGYWRAKRLAARHGFDLAPFRAACFFLLGLGVWLIATVSFIGVYADSLFWVRALQFVLLFFMVPFGLALGTPITVTREAFAGAGRERFDRVLASTPVRLCVHPAVTGVSMLALPWLVYLTGWYPALLTNAVVDEATRLVLVLVGFAYFYSRLQSDPTPRKYPQLITLLLSVGESIGDGILGITLALSAPLAADYYAARGWGPSLRTDQVIGAGILWILGDVLGVPFVIAVLRSLRAEERHVEEATDAALDQLEEEPQATTGLWWESDPQLRDRFRR